MKKGFLSFAIATFVLLVLFYFVAISFTLEDYQHAGQKRLEAQLLSQRYQDAVVFFNDTVADAIEDAAFNSTFAGACSNNPTDTFRTGLEKRLVEYLNNASSRLSTDSVIVSFNWNDTAKAWAETSPESPVQKVTVLKNDPPCGNGTITGNDIEMNRISTEIRFLVNVTSRDGTSGYFNRPFNYRYDVLMNSSAGANAYYFRISQELLPDAYYRCILVTSC